MKSKLLICCMLLIYAPIMLLQSCSQRKKTPVIGLLMDDFKVERWAKDTTYFIKAVKELDGKVICMNAQGDADKQFEQAKTLIAKNVDVIVIVPVDLKKAAEIVLIAQKASKGVISYDRLIQNAFIDYYISFDNVKVGELQADYIRKRMGKGNIALIGGPSTDQNSFYLRYGQLGALQPYIERGEVKIVYDKPVGNWTFDEGYKATVECLKTKNVNAIIAGNDLLARGAIKALQERGLAGKVLVAGQDADTQACENIISGLQTISIYKSIEELASKAAKMAVDMAKCKQITNTTITINNGFKMVPSLLLTPTLVNKGNIGLQVQTQPISSK